MTKRTKCLKCNREYREKKMPNFTEPDGTRHSFETIPDLCDKCFKKKLKLVYILQNAILEGKINIRELKDYKEKKISREQLDKWLRERKKGLYDNKDDIEKIKGVVLNE